jgi:hypothetical protein
LDQARRYVFSSPEWLAAFHAVMTATVAASAAEQPDLTFSMAELALDAPPDIVTGGRGGGWSCFVKSGRVVRFEAGEVAGVDYSVVGTYDVMARLCRYEVGAAADRAAEYKAMTAALFEAGKLRVSGVLPRLPRPFARMHDIVASLTA